MKKLSKNISWSELKCKDGTPYPEKWEDRGRRLAELFEDIRNLTGNFPIEVYSAYRTEEWNRKIKGARNSQHKLGRALDLHHSVLTNNEFYEIIWTNREELRIRGLGRYKTFIHVDIRPSDKIVVWLGSGVKDSQGKENA